MGGSGFISRAACYPTGRLWEIVSSCQTLTFSYRGTHCFEPGLSRRGTGQDWAARGCRGPERAGPGPFPGGALPSSLDCPSSSLLPQQHPPGLPPVFIVPHPPGRQSPWQPLARAPMAEGNRYHPPTHTHTFHTLISLSFVFQTSFFYAPHSHPQMAPSSPRTGSNIPPTPPPPQNGGGASSVPPGEVSAAQARFSHWLPCPPPTGSRTPKPTSSDLAATFSQNLPDVFPLPGSNTLSASWLPHPALQPCLPPGARPLTHFRGILEPPAPGSRRMSWPPELPSLSSSSSSSLPAFPQGPKPSTSQPACLQKSLPPAPGPHQKNALTGCASKPDPTNTAPPTPPRGSFAPKQPLPAQPVSSSCTSSHPTVPPPLLLHLHPKPCPLSHVQGPSLRERAKHPPALASASAFPPEPAGRQTPPHLTSSLSVPSSPLPCRLCTPRPLCTLLLLHPPCPLTGTLRRPAPRFSLCPASPGFRTHVFSNPGLAQLWAAPHSWGTASPTPAPAPRHPSRLTSVLRALSFCPCCCPVLS